MGMFWKYLVSKAKQVIKLMRGKEVMRNCKFKVGDRICGYGELGRRTDGVLTNIVKNFDGSFIYGIQPCEHEKHINWITRDVTLCPEDAKAKFKFEDGDIICGFDAAGGFHYGKVFSRIEGNNNMYGVKDKSGKVETIYENQACAFYPWPDPVRPEPYPFKYEIGDRVGVEFGPGTSAEVTHRRTEPRSRNNRYDIRVHDGWLLDVGEDKLAYYFPLAPYKFEIGDEVWFNLKCWQKGTGKARGIVINRWGYEENPKVYSVLRNTTSIFSDREVCVCEEKDLRFRAIDREITEPKPHSFKYEIGDEVNYISQDIDLQWGVGVINARTHNFCYPDTYSICMKGRGEDNGIDEDIPEYAVKELIYRRK